MWRLFVSLKIKIIFLCAHFPGGWVTLRITPLRDHYSVSEDWLKILRIKKLIYIIFYAGYYHSSTNEKHLKTCTLKLAEVLNRCTWSHRHNLLSSKYFQHIQIYKSLQESRLRVFINNHKFSKYFLTLFSPSSYQHVQKRKKMKINIRKPAMSILIPRLIPQWLMWWEQDFTIYYVNSIAEISE